MAKTQMQPDGRAHDVLAAEAFAMPAPDPRLHRGPVVLPDDPSGIEEAHDVLAAEEFAMPAPTLAARSTARRGQPSSMLVIRAVGALLGLALLRRALRRS